MARRLDSKTTKEGHVIWSGIILDTWSANFRADKAEFDPANSVILVRDGDTITGNVHVNAEWYKIRPLKTGAHAVKRRVSPLSRNPAVVDRTVWGKDSVGIKARR